jgi:hypothetical protein
MNTYKKYTINSTKIAVSYICSQKSNIQISSQLLEYNSLYGKDKLIKQINPREQDKPKSHSSSIQCL